MPMTRADKETFIKNLNELLSHSKMAVLTDFRGVGVNDITKLRKGLRDNKAQYQVVKNKLFQIAAKGTKVEELSKGVVGPTGLAFTDGDPVGLAKMLREFQKEVEAFEIKEGFLGDGKLSQKDIEALSELPSREELIARALRSMMAPIQNFHGVLSALPRNLVCALDAVRRKKEEAGE